MDKTLSALIQFGDQLTELVIFADTKGRILQLNQAAQKYFSVDPATLKSMSLSDWLISKKANNELLAACDKAFSVKKSFIQEYKSVTNLNDDILIHWTIIRDEPTQIIQLIGKFNSLEQTVDSYEQIAYSFRQIEEVLPGNYWWKDKNGVYRGCNKNFETLLNIKMTDVIGKTDYELPWALSADQLLRHDKEVISSGQTQKREEVLEQENGVFYHVLVIKAPLRNSKGEIIGTFGTSFDITDRKKAEEALRIAKEEAEAANQAKTEFLENMRHDVRTPLTGIVGFAQIIRDETLDMRIKEYADNLVASSQSLMEFLNEILETIRMTTGEIPLFRKKFNLEEKLEDVIHLMQAKARLKKLDLTLDYDKEIPTYLVGDSKRIHRIVLELLTNAVNFTEKGSVIVGVQLAQRNERDLVIKIMVKDTGIGISPEQQDNIFARFKRLTPSYEGVYKGMGLGLSVVKQFIDDLEAEIYVESKPKEGSLFTCLFQVKTALLDDAYGAEPTPRREEITVNTTLRKAEQPYGTETGKTSVLIVEDQHIAAQVAKSILESLNCTVDIAYNGQEALQKTSEQMYDLIFMDVGLPDMDGCRVAREMRLKEWSSEKHIPILALTAHIDSENKQRCIAAGMDAVLSKPLSKDKALDLLNAFIPERALKLEKEKEVPVATADADQALLTLEGPVIDLKLGAQLLGGRKELALEMLTMLVASFDEELAELKKAHESEDWTAVSDWAHKMRGGACYCGTPRLRQACERLEDYVRACKTELLPALYEQMLVEVEAVRQEFLKLES